MQDNPDILDALNVLSFLIGLMNLDMNISLKDLNGQTAELDAKVNDHIREALQEIQGHLERQDAKINKIMERINDSK